MRNKKECKVKFKFNLKIIRLVFLLFAAYFLLLIIYNFKLTAYIWKQDTNIDFNTGFFSNVSAKGTGTGGYIEIKQVWSNKNPTPKPS